MCTTIELDKLLFNNRKTIRNGQFVALNYYIVFLSQTSMTSTTIKLCSVLENMHVQEKILLS